MEKSMKKKSVIVAIVMASMIMGGCMYVNNTVPGHEFG